MTIKHTPPYLILFTVIALLAVTSGSARAQDSPSIGAIIVSTYERSFQRGGFLRPGESLDDYLPEEVDPRIVDNLVGYIIYFGDRADIALDRSYTIQVSGALANPKITVFTYHDTAKLARYAYHFGYRLQDFVRDLGLSSAQDQIAKVPVGTVVAVNERGTKALTFRPVTGDVGAYFIVISSFDDDAYGAYTVSISA